MKKFWRSTAMTGVLFALAIMLLSAGVIGGTQAALSEPSRNYVTTLSLSHIGVALYQNDSSNPVAWRTYLNDVNGAPNQRLDGPLKLNLDGDKEILVGKEYPMQLAVTNTGNIDQYVRLVIHKYWVKGAEASATDGWFHDGGNKVVAVDYSPSYIQMRNTDSNWIRDDAASTDEREIYYYKGHLGAGLNSNPLLLEVSISGDVLKDVVKEETGNMTTYRYAYNGYGFVIEAEVDAVQANHARVAIPSAWGTSDTMMNTMGVPSAA